MQSSNSYDIRGTSRRTSKDIADRVAYVFHLTHRTFQNPYFQEKLGIRSCKPIDDILLISKPKITKPAVVKKSQRISNRSPIKNFRIAFPKTHKLCKNAPKQKGLHRLFRINQGESNYLL